MVRYRLTEPGAPEKITNQAEKNHLNTLFVQVHGRADAYYESDIEPRSEALKDLPRDYDPLKEILKQGHEAGLEVHAWVNAYYAWNRPPPLPESPMHVVNRRPDWLLTDDQGRRIDEYSKEEMANNWIEGLYLDPAIDEVRNYLTEVCTEIARKYPVDGIHLDFMRYPGSGFGFNAKLRDRFIARYGVDPLLISKKARYLKSDPKVWLAGKASLIDRWNHYYYALWNAEKSRAINETVRQIYKSVKAVRPRAVLSAAVIPDPDKAYYYFSQDWRNWLRGGYLDLVVPMSYYGDINRVRSQVEAAAQVAGKSRVYAGLGAWIKDTKAISREIAMLRESGIKGFSLFSYGGITEKGPYLHDLRYDSMPLEFRPPGLLPRIAGRMTVKPDANGSDWLDEQYDWSKISGEEAAKMDLKLLKKLEDRLTEKALLEKAVAAGVRAGNAEVSEYAKALEGEFYSRREFNDALKALGMSPLEMKRFLEQEIILYKYITARFYPEAMPRSGDKVEIPSSAEISYIFRVFHFRDGRERREAAKKLMEAVLAKLDSGEDFTNLAKKFSQGGNAAYGGKAGAIYYRPGKRINDIIFSLEEGGHSRIVKGSNGYYIYKVDSFKPPYEAEYKNLQWKHRRRIFQERLAMSVEQALAAKAQLK